MALDLADYERKAQVAVKAFWRNRDAARLKQRAAGNADRGERAGVTAGKNMDGFIALIADVVRANGLGDAEIHQARAVLALPGFFRPTKLWDLLVLHKNELIAAIELKSQIGPSFGNNFNNRAEEAIGTAHDFWTAYREGVFGNQPRPFVGWLILVEDAEKSRTPIRTDSSHFAVFEDFVGASYVERYNLLCRKLVRERLYTTASVIASPRNAARTGDYTDISSLTGLKTLVTTLAGHVAAEAARLS